MRVTRTSGRSAASACCSSTDVSGVSTSVRTTPEEKSRSSAPAIPREGLELNVGPASLGGYADSQVGVARAFEVGLGEDLSQAQCVDRSAAPPALRRREAPVDSLPDRPRFVHVGPIPFLGPACRKPQ